jgi:hypothetical protein
VGEGEEETGGDFRLEGDRRARTPRANQGMAREGGRRGEGPRWAPPSGEREGGKGAWLAAGPNRPNGRLGFLVFPFFFFFSI